MVLYNCIKCNYHTSIKTHYNRHTNTKKHVKNITTNGDDNKKSIKKVYFGSEHDVNDDDNKNVLHIQNGIEYGPIIYPGNTKVTQSNTTQYICDSCEKHFFHKNSYYRHIKHYCKKKIDETIFNEYKQQQQLLVQILIDSKKEIIDSKNELIAEKDKNMKDKVKLYETMNHNQLFQYNDSRQIKDSFNTMNNTNYVLNYLNYSEADTMENIKDKFKLTREEYIKASLTHGYRGALFEKASDVIIKPYLKGQEKRPMQTVDSSRKKALYKDNSNDNWTFNPKTTLDDCFKTFHLSVVNHQDETIKENPNIVFDSVEDNLYKQTYFIPTEIKEKETIYRDVKNHIYQETKVNKFTIDCDNKFIKDIQKMLLE